MAVLSENEISKIVPSIFLAMLIVIHASLISWPIRSVREEELMRNTWYKLLRNVDEYNRQKSVKNVQFFLLLYLILSGFHSNVNIAR